MLFRKLLITLLFFISLTSLNADTFEIRPYKISSEQQLQTIQNTEELKTGLALDIKADKTSKLNYTVAYEGDYMFMNNYLEDERQIKNNNYYIGIGYKF